MRWRDDPASIRPMLATLAEPPLVQPGLLYEPKYDGIRALVHLDGPEVRIWSRLGNEKTSQFPSLVHALRTWGAAVRRPLLVDGEIVALDRQGRPAGFQRLQGRIHLTGVKDVERIERQQPVAFIAFDLLRDGDDDLRGLPLAERRARLERHWRTGTTGTADTSVRLSEQSAGDGRDLHERAVQEGWEGLVAKEARAPYQSGRRSPAWRKLKVLCQQEFIVGGWTEPRQTRQYFGALLLGVLQDGRLKYVGHTGTGFNGAELERVWRIVKRLETDRSPFSERIKTNEPAHWVRPELVAQVRFTEWTADGKLRHPVYLGLRDDKTPGDVRREHPEVIGSRDSDGRPPSEASVGARGGGTPRALRKADGERLARRTSEVIRRPSEARRPARPASAKATAVRPPQPGRPPQLDQVIAQLRALEDTRRDGTIGLPDGSRLGVTNLVKIFWPRQRYTKGDLLRYYARVAPFLLPAVADRPLVMKRFPNGIEGKAFYQQRSEKEKPPAGVRVEVLPDEADPISDPGVKRFVGGSLITLLYMTQIAAISQDPWFSRVQSPLDADYVAIDLDPGEGATFDRVIDVARWVHDELESLKVASVPKTSGSRGLHIYIPLAPGTSYESGMLFCQIVATVIANRHPKLATVERAVRARRRGTIYVDYLQNIAGKTLATAYSARASEFAGVSTPLDWKEVDGVLDPREFTIETGPERFGSVGDLWARLRDGRPADLEAVFRKYSKPG
jgi:bifunctional non-homologous end joining protein LigD